MKRAWTPLESRIRRSEELASLPDDTSRLFFLLLLAQLDSFGRAGANRSLLNADVWPLLDRTQADTERCLQACADAGLLEVHKLGSERWVQIPGWEEGPGPGPNPERRGVSEWPSPSADTLQSKSSVRLPRARARVSCHVPVSGSPGESARGGDEPPLPREVDTPEVQAAVADYQESRREQGHKPLKPQGLKALYGKLARWGPDGAVAALRDSIANGYQGVFLPKGWSENGPPQRALSFAEQTQRNADLAFEAMNRRQAALENGHVDALADRSETAVRSLPEKRSERGDDGRVRPGAIERAS